MKLYTIDAQNASTTELREAIKERALNDLKMVKNRTTPPDHLIYPEIFAWAIKNLYTVEQKQGIWFDHDENEEIFCKRHQVSGGPTDIAEHIREKLIESRAALKKLDLGDWDRCCSCLEH